jgi:site-specific recombinase XerD
MTLVDAWLEWLATDRGRQPNTIQTYARTLRTLTAFEFDLQTATPEQLETWWKSRATDAHGNPRPHSSRNNELAAVRSFYKWMYRFDHVARDPTRRLDVLRVQKRTSKFVGQADLDRLLRKLPPDLRRAVALGAYGGLRVSEAAALDWDHIDIPMRRMIVLGKGNDERPVGLSTRLLNVLLPEIPDGNVVTGKPDPYSAHYLQLKVNQAMKRNGVTLTFHALRHRFGFIAAADGVPTTSIAKAMGHASIQTTMGYVGAVDSDLDRIATAVSR